MVELCEEVLPTYFIESAEKIVDKNRILHFDLHSKIEKETTGYLPDTEKVNIILTCGASCPDSVVEGIMIKILSYFETESTPEILVESLNIMANY